MRSVTTARSRVLQRPLRALPARLALLACAAFVLPAPGALAAGEGREASRRSMQSLDEQVQEIKSEVLGIAAELRLLEEKLLFPSNTQVAVFVSLSAGEGLRLDSLKLRIDGEPVAHHVYSFEELEALRKGGVQRLYTGNVRAGDHRVEVVAAGKGPGGDFEHVEQLAFTKAVEPKLLGVTVSGPSRVALEDW